MIHGDPKDLPALTARQTEVLLMIGEGLSNSEIGKHLSLSRKTVEDHVTQILTKLGVRSRAQAILHAQEQGLLGAGPLSAHPLVRSHYQGSDLHRWYSRVFLGSSSRVFHDARRGTPAVGWIHGWAAAVITRADG